MDETVVLDACCILNITATGRAGQILNELPHRFALGHRARGEALWLAAPDSDEREPVDLGPLLAAGLLTEALLDGPAEAALFVEFAATLADGEAEAAALAVARGYVLATDDRKARRTVAARYPSARLTGTLELIHEWQLAAAPPDVHVTEALRRISERATYQPRSSHPLRDWWVDLTDW